MQLSNVHIHIVEGGLKLQELYSDLNLYLCNHKTYISFLK